MSKIGEDLLFRPWLVDWRGSPCQHEKSCCRNLQILGSDLFPPLYSGGNNAASYLWPFFHRVRGGGRLCGKTLARKQAVTVTRHWPWPKMPKAFFNILEFVDFEGRRGRTKAAAAATPVFL